MVSISHAGAGAATIQFLRYVPPKAVAVTLDKADAPTTITVTLPRLNYPEMVFAGAATQADLDAFLAEVQAVPGTPPILSSNYPSVSMPDPDVVTGMAAAVRLILIPVGVERSRFV